MRKKVENILNKDRKSMFTFISIYSFNLAKVVDWLFIIMISLQQFVLKISVFKSLIGVRDFMLNLINIIFQWIIETILEYVEFRLFLRSKYIHIYYIYKSFKYFFKQVGFLFDSFFFMIFHPIAFIRLLKLLKYFYNEYYIWNELEILNDCISKFFDKYLTVFADHFVQMEEDVLYGASKEERAQWYYTSYEYLRVKKGLSDLLVTIKEPYVRWWKSKITYNFFTLLPKVDRDLLESRFFEKKKKMEISYNVLLSEIVEYDRQLINKRVLLNGFFQISLTLLFLYFENFCEKNVPFVVDSFIYKFVFKSVYSFLLSVSTLISFFFSFVYYFLFSFLPFLVSEVLLLVFIVPLRIIYIFVYCLILFNSEYFEGLIKHIMKGWVLTHTAPLYFKNFKNLLNFFPSLKAKYADEAYLDEYDVPLLFNTFSWVYSDLLEIFVTDELDSAFGGLSQEFAKYVYLKRSIMMFCLHCCNQIFTLLFRIQFLNKVYFIFLPIITIVFYCLFVFYVIFWLFFGFVKLVFFLGFKLVLYGWFNLGTRLKYIYYQRCWDLAERLVLKGNIWLALVCQYVIPFILDFFILIFRSLIIGFLFLLLYYFFSDIILAFLQQYPKWYKYYIFVIYFIYFISGLFLSIFSRKFREVFFENIDFIIENFFTILFTIHILNFLMVPPYTIRELEQDSIRWRYRWRYRRMRYRKMKKWMRSYRDYFDKGAWQTYSDRRYISKKFWLLLEDTMLHEEQQPKKK